MKASTISLIAIATSISSGIAQIETLVTQDDFKEKRVYSPFPATADQGAIPVRRSR